MNIVALDLSLAATGYATDNGTGTIRPREKGGMARLAEIRTRVTEVVHGANADLVIIEGYSFGSKFTRAHSLGELGGIIRIRLWDHNVPVVDVAPASRIRYATGRGNASKAVVVGAIAARTGITFADDNQADAYILRAMACAHYDVPIVGVPASHSEALRGVDWPTIEPARPVAGY